MRREDTLALIEENRRLREEIFALEEQLYRTHQSEAAELRRRLTALEKQANGEPEDKVATGALAAVLAGVAISLGLAGGLASLLFAATPKTTYIAKQKETSIPSHKETEFGRLWVTGEPFHASLRLDKEPIGQAPLFMSIEPGYHMLEIFDEQGSLIEKMELFAQPQQTIRATYHAAPSKDAQLKSSHFIEVE